MLESSKLALGIKKMIRFDWRRTKLSREHTNLAIAKCSHGGLKVGWRPPACRLPHVQRTAIAGGKAQKQRANRCVKNRVVFAA